MPSSQFALCEFAFSRRSVCAIAVLAPAIARAQTAPFRVMEAREGALRLAPAPASETPVWGYDGMVPGPLLRVKKGEEVRVRLVNKLTQPTAIHWHGVRVPNAMDGAIGLTQAPVAPAASFDYRFTPPDSGFFWYRASGAPFAAEQKGRGLYGALIVDEPNPPAVDQDVLIVLDDWRLDEKGAIDNEFLKIADVRGEGRIGSTISVNSTPAPQVIPVQPGARIRLRVLNACNARLAGLLFENMNALVIAIDGQPCDPFRPARNMLPTWPGARYDLVADLPTAGEEPRLALLGDGGEPDRSLVNFRAAGKPRPALPAATGLPLNPLLPPVIKLQNARRLDLAIEPGRSNDALLAWTLNGVSGSPGAKPLFSVARGQPVSLGFVNRSQVAHVIHLHGHHFRVLHLLDDGWEPYWRDSALVAPGRTVRIAFVADNSGKWLIESAILEHAMGGLSAWFEVKKPADG